MLPKKGKTFPRNGHDSLGSRGYAEEISRSLRSELGGSHQSVKTVMKWTRANERTIKNWLAGTNGPSGEHLIALIEHSDEVCCLVLRLAGRNQAQAAIRLADARQRHVAAISAIDGVDQS